MLYVLRSSFCSSVRSLVFTQVVFWSQPVIPTLPISSLAALLCAHCDVSREEIFASTIKISAPDGREETYEGDSDRLLGSTCATDACSVEIIR